MLAHAAETVEGFINYKLIIIRDQFQQLSVLQEKNNTSDN